MVAAVGILTSRGGKTSHAAVVARGMGKTAVCGAEEIEVNENEKFAMVNGIQIKEGDYLSIDGATGEVFNSQIAVEPSTVVRYLQEGITIATEGKSEEVKELIKSVDRILRHADRRRRLIVRANADTESDAATARKFGAQEIGRAHV